MTRKQPPPPPYKPGDTYTRPNPPPMPPKVNGGKDIPEPPKPPTPPPSRYVYEGGGHKGERGNIPQRKPFTNEKILIILTAFFIFAFLFCWMAYDFHRKSTPDCFSELTKNSVTELSQKAFKDYVNNLTGKQINPDVSFSVADIREQSKNPDNGALLCAANFSAKGNGGYVTLPIHFTVEKTEKVGKFFYTIIFD